METHFAIDGMHCGKCVQRVTDALNRVEGVEKADVAIGSAKVRFDAAKTTAQALMTNLANAGYPAAEKNGS